MKNLTEISLTLFSCLFLSCTQQPFTLHILDAASKQPIEGARIYVKDHRLALRSDIRGTVALPPEIGSTTVTIRAKNYRPVEKQLAAGGTLEIPLTFDSTRVNPVERRLKFTRADTLRGAYGPYRAHNDLLFYDLTIRLEAARQYLSRYKTIRFKMLEAGARIQIDLFENMQIDSIVFKDQNLSYEREFNAVFVDFPEMLRKGQTYSIDFHYSGNPVETGRFGGIAFKQDSLGNPWIYTACQGIGASLW